MNKRHIFIAAILIGVLWLSSQNGLAQENSQGKKKLTYEQAFQFRGGGLTNPLPRISGWLDDNNYLEQREDEQDQKRKLFKVNAATGKASVYFDPEEFKDVLPEGFSLLGADIADDYSGALFNRNNDLYYLNLKTKTFKQLTNNPADESNPTFSPDGKLVAFTRDHNLFAITIENGEERQLTIDGSETVYNGWASWVYYEEILGRGSRYRSFYWSPDSKKLAFLRFDDSPVPTFPLFRADGQHGELEITRYPEAGDPNPYVKLGIVPATGGAIVWADFVEKADHYVAWIFWTPDSKTLTTQWMNRDQTNLKIYTINLIDGSKTEIYNENLDSWVEFLEDLYIFKNGSGFIVRSDVDGWRHLYYYDMTGKLQKRLTKGEWRVQGIERVDEKNGVVYFMGNKDETTESHLFKVKLDGTGLTRLTKEPGTHRTQVSPGGSYFIDSYSNISMPTKMALFKNNGKMIRELGDSKSAEMDDYDLGKVELFRIKTGDGYNLPALWYLPPDFDKSKKYPVIFSIYGGPNSSGVANSFPFRMSSYYFAQEGVIMISVDHRGSGHFGKKGVALMYRNLGKWEMHDWIEAVQWLRSQPFVDPARMGITGGSYGGYATLMALTYGSEYFTHGISMYPVTDWKLYDTVYTERYMDTPAANPAGYEFGSVLTHADKLQGKLLLIHGTMDDNVHMQNTIQLVDLFTQTNKQFELMFYPNSRHGVGGQQREHLQTLTFNFWVENGFLPEAEK